MSKVPELKRRKDNGLFYIYFRRRQISFGTDEKIAKKQYLIFIRDNFSRPTAAPPETSNYFLTELVSDWLQFCIDSNNSHLSHYKSIGKIILEKYSDLLASEFSGRALKRLQCDMIEKGYSRRYINYLVNLTRTMFRWALSEELIDGNQYAALKAVDALRAGKSAAKEKPPRRAATVQALEAVKPFVNSVVRDMLTVQYLTGMRSCELVSMRYCDINIENGVPVYFPPDKNKWRDRADFTRAVPLPPRVWEIVKSRAGNQPPEWFIFNPGDAAAEQRQVESEKSHNPRNILQNRQNGAYTPASYGRAVKRGFERLRASGAKIEPFSPYQLRHLAITEVSREFGVDAAGAFAGHHSDVTRVYDHSQFDKAVRVAIQR